MNQPTPKKLSLPAFARKYVTVCLAKQLPAEAITEALDALTLWRGLRAHYASYAQHQDAVVIRPDEAALMLPAGTWEALTPERRKELRGLINKEAATQRQMLAAVRRFIDGQCLALETASPAFKDAYQERLTEYLAEDIASTPLLP